MNAIDAANAPVEFDFNGRKLKLRRLSLEDIFAATEARVISEHIQHGAQMSRELDPPDRAPFLAAHMDNIPDGKRLRTKTKAFLDTFKGDRLLIFLAAKLDNPEVKTEADLAGIITTDNTAEIANAVDWVCGLTQKKT